MVLDIQRWHHTIREGVDLTHRKCSIIVAIWCKSSSAAPPPGPPSPLLGSPCPPCKNGADPSLAGGETPARVCTSIDMRCVMWDRVSVCVRNRAPHDRSAREPRAQKRPLSLLTHRRDVRHPSLPLLLLVCTPRALFAVVVPHVPCCSAQRLRVLIGYLGWQTPPSSPPPLAIRLLLLLRSRNVALRDGWMGGRGGCEKWVGGLMGWDLLVWWCRLG